MIERRSSCWHSFIQRFSKIFAFYLQIFIWMGRVGRWQRGRVLSFKAAGGKCKCFTGSCNLSISFCNSIVKNCSFCSHIAIRSANINYATYLKDATLTKMKLFFFFFFFSCSNLCVLRCSFKRAKSIGQLGTCTVASFPPPPFFLGGGGFGSCIIL